MAYVLDGFRLWFRHFLLFTGLTLTVWLPGNILMILAEQSASTSGSLLVPALLQLLINPFLAIAILYATHQLYHGRTATFLATVSFAFRKWVAMFLTDFTASIFIGLGFLILVIPGLVMIIRYALIGPVVAFEGRTGVAAIQRSSEIVRNCWAPVLAVNLAAATVGMVLMFAVYAALDTLYFSLAISDQAYMVLDVVANCLADVIVAPLTIILYFIYVDQVGIETEDSPEEDGNDDDHNVISFAKDDGNPYGSPLTE